MSAIEFRRVEGRDLDAARPLLASEGWGFTRAELERLARLGGALGGYADDRLVAFLTYVDVEPVRWIGNVVVSNGARGQGVGASLLEATFAQPGRVTTTGLYSVEKAVTLYERANFVPQGEAFALAAAAAQPKGKARGVEPMQDTDLPAVFRLDRTASAMDRRALLGELFADYTEHCRVMIEGDAVTGFAMAKTYDDLTEIGPVVARDRVGASALLDSLLADTPGPHEATVLGGNPEALALLEARGFGKRFRTVPMFRGPAPAWNPKSLVTAAGLEKS